MQAGPAVAPYTVRSGGKAYRAAHAALAQAWGRPAVDIGVGGSISFVTGYAGLVPGAEILITGVEDPDTRAHGANVFVEPWKGFAAQKNSAIDKAAGDWILSLDADEEVERFVAD